MSFIDSPISRCEAVREMVLTDQTQGQCALEHGCPPGRNCPLDGCFAEISGVTEAAHHVQEESPTSWQTEPSEPVKSSFSAVPTKDQERLAA